MSLKNKIVELIPGTARNKRRNMRRGLEKASGKPVDDITDDLVESKDGIGPGRKAFLIHLNKTDHGG